MRCSSVRSRLSAFHDGELGPSELNEVRSHLMDCLRCRSAASELRTLSRYFDREEVIPAMSAGFTDSVMARIHTPESAFDTSSDLASVERFARWLAVAAILVIGVSATFLWSSSPTRANRDTLDAAPQSAVDRAIRENDAAAAKAAAKRSASMERRDAGDATKVPASKPVK